MALLDSHAIEIPCPRCGHKASKTIGWLKDHATFTCAGCNEEITVTGDFFEQIKLLDAQFAALGKRR